MEELIKENAELKKQVESLKQQLAQAWNQLTLYQKRERKRWFNDTDHLSYEDRDDR